MTQTFSLPARIDMVAISDTANIRRHYRIICARDLFDQIVVDLHWGRIGTRGQSKQVSFAGQTEADKYVAQVLRRRASAKKRLGVAYQIL
jgi:predicted DNA-binding WGR domain protein